MSGFFAGIRDFFYEPEQQTSYQDENMAAQQDAGSYEDEVQVIKENVTKNTGGLLRTLHTSNTDIPYKDEFINLLGVVLSDTRNFRGENWYALDERLRTLTDLLTMWDSYHNIMLTLNKLDDESFSQKQERWQHGLEIMFRSLNDFVDSMYVNSLENQLDTTMRYVEESSK